MKQLIEGAINIVKDSLFPQRCICGKVDTVLCEECYQKIPKNKKDLCPLCKKLSDNGRVCERCKYKSRLTGVMVFAKHENGLKDAIWNFKYESIIDLSGPLTNLLVEKYGDFIKKKRFLIVSVPISKERRNWRGYNQAEELAVLLAKKTESEYLAILEKKESTPQVGLTRNERIRNIYGKIVVKQNVNIRNKKLLIVDDVYTTGSTLEECAKALRKNGAKEVWGIVLSRD